MRDLYTAPFYYLKIFWRSGHHACLYTQFLKCRLPCWTLSLEACRSILAEHSQETYFSRSVDPWKYHIELSGRCHRDVTCFPVRIISDALRGKSSPSGLRAGGTPYSVSLLGPVQGLLLKFNCAHPFPSPSMHGPCLQRFPAVPAAFLWNTVCGPHPGGDSRQVNLICVCLQLQLKAKSNGCAHCPLGPNWLSWLC